MQLKMIKTAKGSPDGLKVVEYQKGETYEIPEELAKVFLEQMKVAVFEIETPEDPQEEIETPEDPKPEVKPRKKRRPRKKGHQKGRRKRINNHGMGIVHV